ncbi:hypothetical protein HDU98_008010 [Podochytrium sp. JEL0797]|nr:hypothetical protein HDU98_008010 [Podochytrium sp. JEL0797]
MSVVLVLGGSDGTKHQAILDRLHQGGLETKTVAGDKDTFVVATAPASLLLALRKEESREVSRDGSRDAEATPADAVRLIHGFITKAKYRRGLGIKVCGNLTKANGPLKDEQLHWLGGESIVKDIVVLHDEAFNKKWVTAWEHKWILATSDITEIQKHMGEQVAFYFAFLQFYLQALIPLAAFGFLAHFVLPSYSYTYAIVLSLWGIAFIAAWKRREVALAMLWGSTSTDSDRPEFIPDRLEIDPQTSEPIPYYPFWKRWVVHAGYTAPMVLFFGTAVSLVSVLILVAEVFTAQVYEGPNKGLVKMLPILIYVLCLPLLQAVYMALSSYITNLENSQSVDSHNASLTRKAFIITSLLTQLSLFLTGIVFIPVSDLLVPYLAPQLTHYGVADHIVGLNATETRNLLSPSSLQEKVISFSIVNQIITQVIQVVIPAVLAWWNLRSLRAIEQKEKLAKEEKDNKESSPLTPRVTLETVQLSADETLKLDIEKALALPVYNMYEDYAELANQFGLVILFSSSWSLVAAFCVLFNFLNMRTHAFKVCRSVRRPIPHRTATLTPWTSILSGLSTLGTLTTTLLTLLYHNWDATSPASHQSLPHAIAFGVVLVAAEHAHFFVSWIAEAAVWIVWGDLEALAGQRRAWEVGVLGRVVGKAKAKEE